jgi:hypothetical protein
MAARTLSGARAQLAMVDPTTGTAQVVGIFNNVSYGQTYSAEPIYVLGSFSPVETVYTAAEAIHISASGWRVFGKGAHVSGGVPALDKILSHEYLEMTVFDRQNPGTPIAKFKSVRPTGYSTSIANRQASEISVNFVGLRMDDESTVNEELPDSTRFKGPW